LDEYLAILNRLRQYSLEEFLANAERYGSAERFLQLAIEATIDIGNHLIATLSLGTVNWYSDVPAILMEAGYLDGNLREQWIRMIGFRNTLVHDYIDIDRTIVHDVLQHHLKEIETLRDVFVQFL
jgi:uncharacterized protein YutE (UPF0331/DUF86 family)